MAAIEWRKVHWKREQKNERPGHRICTYKNYKEVLNKENDQL